MNSFLLVFDLVVTVLLVFWLVTYVIGRYRRGHYATVLSQDEFQKGSHKAQVIDLRQKADFDRGHILGARNLPYAFMKQQYGELRSDLPIYMYDQGMSMSTNAAAFLGRRGYKKLYILDGGYAKWDGKTKKAKY